MANSFLRRVRIHGGEFGASARAMHRNAELGKVPNSTIERKQMSTKTTFKRVALVTVAALGFGLLSVVPSKAVIGGDSLTLSAATAAITTADTATGVTAELKFAGTDGVDSISVTAQFVSGPAVFLPYLRLTETSSVTIDGVANPAVGRVVQPNESTTVVAKSSTAFVSAKWSIILANPTDITKAATTAGTYVVRLTPRAQGSGVLIGATAQTLTITVTTAPSLDTVANSATVIMSKGETNSATTDAVVTHPQGTQTEIADSARAAAATIKVSLLNAAGATASESYTATIAGPGILGSSPVGTTAAITGGTPTGRAITVKATDLVQVFNDGSAGVATVTISSAAGKVLGTEKVTFYGATASAATTVKKAVIGTAASSGADALLVVLKDAAGVEIQNVTTLYVVSSDTTKISGAYTPVSVSHSATDGGYLVALTGVAAGTSNITVTTKSSATATGVDAAAVAVRVGSATPASVAVTLDKATYLPGEKATVTIALKDSSGLDLASGDYSAIFATGGISTSYVLGNGSDTMTDTVVRGYALGKKTYTVYMPIVSAGTVDFTWTGGTGLATANQGVAGKVSATLSNAAVDAATDAANEATDAANAATDAANAAAEAADAATAAAQDAADAVAALSTQVNELISALRKQITSLTAIVLKIQKKVKA